MIKNIMLLALMTWVATSYAKTKVAKESLADAHGFKVERPAKESTAVRSLAGSKIKKNKKKNVEEVQKIEESTDGSDSEVRYWKYSEE